ncbi:SymE family type I addiction module toxin [Lelliottia wanjuensis]|jgi:toxic protein SymE|uniref:SymE family type I addiction module toxin n=1 Tax=Lelliottia wanjuensis TaxID=3050585 RepID=UPI00254E151D|nr:SymE family type I addiction module toxin [Lelliottia sp. V86_10]MDK9584200.1 SymE family type I addiction module toxin [Lelliottia sp. V86_10]
MAANEFMPDPTIAQTDPERSEGNDHFPEVTRKKDARRLHGKALNEATAHARADTPQSSAACCELYSRMGHRFLPLAGEWLPKAGFIDGMPVKIRVMPDCIIITPQNTRELWGCLEGMSVAGINQQRVAEWLKTFPGALNDTGNIPASRRQSKDWVRPA